MFTLVEHRNILPYSLKLNHLSQSRMESSRPGFGHRKRNEPLKDPYVEDLRLEFGWLSPWDPHPRVFITQNPSEGPLRLRVSSTSRYRKLREVRKYLLIFLGLYGSGPTRSEEETEIRVGRVYDPHTHLCLYLTVDLRRDGDSPSNIHLGRRFGLVSSILQHIKETYLTTIILISLNPIVICNLESRFLIL